MKIGDKVRYLSETGGGTVAGFPSKNTVLVEDEDGFQIPTPITEVVVIDTDDYNIAKVHTSGVTKGYDDKHHVTEEKQEESEPADRDITFKAKPEERKGGDSLSAYLAFVPVDIKEVSTTTFEAYFINDSNYYMYYTYLSAQGSEWQVRSVGEVEPNTKIFIEEFGRDKLKELGHVAIQIVAYKKDKSFLMKKPIDVQLRIDIVKFYKLHVFRENDFFESPALIYTIIEKDNTVRPLVIDTKELKEQMYQSNTNAKTEKTVVKESAGKDKMPVYDLHASEILETTSGMSSSDILNYQLDYFRKTIDKYKNKKGTKIIFIHGKGDGVLRQAIIHELKYKYKQYSYQDASFREYGYGATQITIR